MVEEQEKKTGVVCWFDPKKGFGYITPDDDVKDYFAHWTQVQGKEGVFKTLKPGQKVSFVLGENDKGEMAAEILVLEEPSGDQ